MDRPDEAIKLLGEAITFLQKTGTLVPAVGRIFCESRSSKSDF
jgi:hypothetical protein